jgi:GNAT superfamily N-acetyltransferase
VQILDVEPRDAPRFDAWFGVVDAVMRRDRPDETAHLPEELRASALEGRPAADGSPPPDERRDLLMALDGDRPVAAVKLDLPLADNTHAAFFWLGVLPDSRRRGVGRAVLDAVVRRAVREGRGTLMTEIDEPPELRGRSPGRGFAVAAGFSCALDEVRRDLPLPVPAARLDALDEQARARAEGYRVFTLAVRWPDALVDSRAELGRRMSTDAPLGSLAWDEESWDGDRVRRQEELFRAQGRRLLAGGAVHEPTGRLVAFTEVAVPLAAPERVWQWDTLVLAEHRGHRLGTLVKTACLRRLQREVPQARLLTTHNAGTNTHMIAVNEALGFRENGVLSDWQRVL